MSNKQHLQFIYDRLVNIHLEPVNLGHMCKLRQIIADHDALQDAANSLAIEAGVINQAVSSDEIAGSVTGELYYVELIRESELRLKALKAAAMVNGIESCWVFERSSGYAGCRCINCHTWVFLDAERKCKC